MSTAVEIETGSRIPTWRTFGGIQWHVISAPRVTLQGERNLSAILKIVLRRILFFFVFYAVWGFGKRRLSYRLQYICLPSNFRDIALLYWNNKWAYWPLVDLITVSKQIECLYVLVCHDDKRLGLAPLRLVYIPASISTSFLPAFRKLPAAQRKLGNGCLNVYVHFV